MIICDRDFSTMRPAVSLTHASNIGFKSMQNGLVCEMCQRFYAPTEGYRSVENGNVVRFRKTCGNDACNSSFFMVLTVDEHGNKMWDCLDCKHKEPFV